MVDAGAYLDLFLFAVLPYAVFLTFFIFTIHRYRAETFTYSSLSSQFLENRSHFWGSVPLHFGILTVLTMEHTTRDGRPKILRRCTLPLTGAGVVRTIITELAVIEVTPNGLLLREIAPGTAPDVVQQATEPALRLSDRLATMCI